VSHHAKSKVDGKAFASAIFAAMESALPMKFPQSLQALQKAAHRQLSTLTFPTTRDEEWRYTDVSALGEIAKSFNQVASSQSVTCAPDEEVDLENYIAQGLLIGELSQLPPDQWQQWQPKLEQYLAKHPDTQDYFATLNTASFSTVAVIFVPKDLAVSIPITVFSTADGLAQPRCLVIAEPRSQLNFIEIYQGDSEGYFCNSVAEIWLGEGAQVNHAKILVSGEPQDQAAIHIANTAVAQSKHSVYRQQSICLGSRLSRHNLNVRQMGEQTETSLSGLAMVNGRQVADTHSCINHQYPYGQSQQLHKCIADDRSHAIFNGKIQVSRAAQLTNSSQMSRNLLLSDKARIDTKPQLEIIADDVKCAHGATVSQLSPEELFYLESRGIDPTQAAKLLIYGFAAEVINQIPVPFLSAQLQQYVMEQTSHESAPK
jgi:Fe-S cluster assembly protein SufD